VDHYSGSTVGFEKKIEVGEYMAVFTAKIDSLVKLVSKANIAF